MAVCGRVDHAEGRSRCCHSDGPCFCCGWAQWEHLPEYGGGLWATNKQVRDEAGKFHWKITSKLNQVEKGCLSMCILDGSWWALCLTVGPARASRSAPLTSVRFETSARAPVMSQTACSRNVTSHGLTWTLNAQQTLDYHSFCHQSCRTLKFCFVIVCLFNCMMMCVLNCWIGYSSVKLDWSFQKLCYSYGMTFV